MLKFGMIYNILKYINKKIADIALAHRLLKEEGNAGLSGLIYQLVRLRP